MRIGTEGSPAEAPTLEGWVEAAVAEERPKVPGSRQGTEKASGERAEPKKGKDDRSQDSLELSAEARAQLDKLKARDRQVRAHEAAHMAAGGSLVRGGASFTYQQGPDGKAYAVGGEVSLDASPVPDDPRATIMKAERLRAAALAPADPSSQDRAVAAQASSMASEAAVELARQKQPSGDAGSSFRVGGQLDLLG